MVSGVNRNRGRAREQVNRRASDGDSGDCPPNLDSFRVAARGWNASKGRSTSRGRRRKGRRKRDEPQGRKRAATCPRRAGGESRRGGVKPRGRNEPGGWHLTTEGGRRATGRDLEWTPTRSRRRRGGSLDNPKRGVGSESCRRQDWRHRQGWRQGHEGRRHGTNHSVPRRGDGPRRRVRALYGVDSFGKSRTAVVARTPRRAVRKPDWRNIISCVPPVSFGSVGCRDTDPWSRVQRPRFGHAERCVRSGVHPPRGRYDGGNSGVHDGGGSGALRRWVGP